MSDPTWDEAVSAFGAAEPVALVRPPRTLVIEIEPHGLREWKATSGQISGFTVYGDSREAAERAASDDLQGWIDPAVTLEFREVR